MTAARVGYTLNRQPSVGSRQFRNIALMAIPFRDAPPVPTMEIDMEASKSELRTSVATVVDADTNMSNEIGLGNLPIDMHTAPDQIQPAPSNDQSPTAAAVTFLLTLPQDNLATAVRFGQVFATGASEMRNVWAEASSSSLKDANEAIAAFASARCINDLVGAQSKLVRSIFERAFARNGQMADSSFKVTHQLLENLSKEMVSVPAGG